MYVYTAVSHAVPHVDMALTWTKTNPKTKLRTVSKDSEELQTWKGIK